MSALLKKIFFVLLGAAALVFFAQNWTVLGARTPIRFDLIFWRFEAGEEGFPLILLCLGCLFFGLVVGGLSGVFEHLARRFQVGSRDRRIHHLEKELAKLKKVPPPPPPPSSSSLPPAPPRS